ncbi:MAG: PepSY-associated TM helix domain-containing protein, partial [Planctomycetota bacterium]|nr:PepSY-associated TM helix domain-containing protein [Planctomycetota bacterium]
MKTFKFFWTTHKWTGISLAIILAVTSVTGFLLLLKKDYNWIQPPTIVGSEGGLESFITNQELFSIVFALDHPELQSLDDVNRVDFRPNKRVFKVRSNSYYEIQVDAVTGEILGQNYRRSDLIETIHDGTFIAQWFHDWVMPVVSGGLLFLTGSGLWLWLEPK